MWFQQISVPVVALKLAVKFFQMRNINQLIRLCTWKHDNVDTFCPYYRSWLIHVTNSLFQGSYSNARRLSDARVNAQLSGIRHWLHSLPALVARWHASRCLNVLAWRHLLCCSEFSFASVHAIWSRTFKLSSSVLQLFYSIDDHASIVLVEYVDQHVLLFYKDIGIGIEQKILCWQFL